MISVELTGIPSFPDVNSRDVVQCEKIFLWLMWGCEDKIYLIISQGMKTLWNKFYFHHKMNIWIFLKKIQDDHQFNWLHVSIHTHISGRKEKSFNLCSHIMPASSQYVDVCGMDRCQIITLIEMIDWLICGSE